MDNTQPVPEVENQKVNYKIVFSLLKQFGLFPLLASVIVLFIYILLAIYLVNLSRNYLVKRTPSPTPLPTQVISPTAIPTVDETANWKTYKNTAYGFDIKYPGNYLIEIPELEFGWLGKHIYFTVSKSDPEGCRGDCPVIYSTEKVKIGNYEAKKMSGYIGAVGGNIPQSYLSYTFISRDRYITFTLYELEKDVQLEEPWSHKPGNIDKDAINTFSQILSTFKFLDENQPLFGDAATKEECLTKGGMWQKWGLTGLEYCQIPVVDADKPCTDGSECSLGRCISIDGATPGKCQKFKHIFGCMNFINNGRAEKTICID